MKKLYFTLSTISHIHFSSYIFKKYKSSLWTFLIVTLFGDGLTLKVVVFFDSSLTRVFTLMSLDTIIILVLILLGLGVEPPLNVCCIYFMIVQGWGCYGRVRPSAWQHFSPQDITSWIHYNLKSDIGSNSVQYLFFFHQSSKRRKWMPFLMTRSIIFSSNPGVIKLPLVGFIKS